MIKPRKRGWGIEITTDSLRTRIGGNYSSNKGRDIKDIVLRSRTTYWDSAGRNQNCKKRGGYKKNGYYTSWDCRNYNGEVRCL